MSTQTKPRLWTKPFILITLLNFMLFLSFQFINPTLPLYLKELGASASTIGLMVSLINFGALLMRPLAGRILDKVGKRQLLVAALLLVALMIHLYVVFPVISVLFVVRFLHGISWGCAATSSNTIASSSIPRRLMGKGMGYFGLSNALSQAIAPAIALSLMTYSGFKLTTDVSVALLLICVVIAIFYPYKDLAQGSKPGANENVTADRKKDAFFERSALLPAVMMFGVTVVMIATTSFIALFGAEIGVANTGLFFTFNAISILAIRPFLGAIIDSRGIMVTLIPCLLSIIVGLALLGFSSNLTMLCISALFCGAGCGGAHTTLQTLAVMGVPANRFGAATGTFFMGFDLGMAFGSIFAGFLAEMFGYGNMFHIIMLLPALSLVIALAQRKK